MPRAARRPVSPPAAAPAPTLGPRAWQGVVYRPCQRGAPAVRELFRFAGAFVPSLEPDEVAWEADADGRIVGGLLCERRGAHGFIHGPVVVSPPADSESLEVAAQLVAPLLDAAPSLGFDTLFTRPQGLDRVWVRLGLVPVPEAFLPADLRDRPGSGLHAWRRPGTYAVPVATAEGDGRRRGRR